MTTLGTAHAQHLLRISDLRPSELSEAANRLATEQAVLYALATGEWE